LVAFEQEKNPRALPPWVSRMEAKPLAAVARASLQEAGRRTPSARMSGVVSRGFRGTIDHLLSQWQRTTSLQPGLK
jgi:hypothetical protein